MMNHLEYINIYRESHPLGNVMVTKKKADIREHSTEHTMGVGGLQKKMSSASSSKERNPRKGEQRI